MPALRFLVLLLAAAAFGAFVLAVRRIVKRESASALPAFTLGAALGASALALWWWGVGPA